MPIDKTLVTRSTSMLILKLLENQDMYGYQMITELARRSQNVFSMKEGTLYPVLHGLEKQGYVEAYQQAAESGRMRKYYRITRSGRGCLAEEKQSWEVYEGAVNAVLRFSAGLA